MYLWATWQGNLALVTAVSGVVLSAALSLPSSAAPASPSAISDSEREATLAALEPPKRLRPLIAVIGFNGGTETTDYLVPYGVLKRADIADVVALGSHDGPITMMPALTIVPDASIAVFDTQHPEGADYVIVPAMHQHDDPATVAWVKAQAANGATIVGICAGAKILGQAGLLDERKATTHWYDLSGVRKDYPSMLYVPDRRLVVDRGVATTTGVAASIPMSLALVEAIAGTARASEVAKELGVESWHSRHDSSAFSVTLPLVLTGIVNAVAFWGHEELGIEIEPGVDEIALALTADAWSRTYRSNAFTVASDIHAVTSRGGIRILPDRVASEVKAEEMLPSVAHDLPARALETTLHAIANRYGRRTMSFVAIQLEYPGRPTLDTGDTPTRSHAQERRMVPCRAPEGRTEPCSQRDGDRVILRESRTTGTGSRDGR